MAFVQFLVLVPTDMQASKKYSLLPLALLILIIKNSDQGHIC